jgi:hypothetical protein
MVENMKEIMLMIKNKEMVLFIGLMVEFIEGNGIMGNSMAKVFI